MNVTTTIETDVDFQIKDGFLTKELMDEYERYFYKLSEDGDSIEKRTERHLGNIAWYLMRGEDSFIEGYGKVSDFIENFNVSDMGSTTTTS